MATGNDDSRHTSHRPLYPYQKDITALVSGQWNVYRADLHAGSAYQFEALPRCLPPLDFDPLLFANWKGVLLRSLSRSGSFAAKTAMLKASLCPLETHDMSMSVMEGLKW